MWSLKGGKLFLKAMPAEQLMWARNSLTQRVIGPKSITTVELSVKGLKAGDVAGLGNINVPCSWIGIVKKATDGKTFTLRCFEQLTNDTTDVQVALPKGKIWLRSIGEYDDNQAQYAYSTDGITFQTPTTNGEFLPDTLGTKALLEVAVCDTEAAAIAWCDSVLS